MEVIKCLGTFFFDFLSTECSETLNWNPLKLFWSLESTSKYVSNLINYVSQIGISCKLPLILKNRFIMWKLVENYLQQESIGWAKTTPIYLFGEKNPKTHSYSYRTLKHWGNVFTAFIQFIHQKIRYFPFLCIMVSYRFNNLLANL